jgi:hypothetical protein
MHTCQPIYTALNTWQKIKAVADGVCGAGLDVEDLVSPINAVQL